MFSANFFIFFVLFVGDVTVLNGPKHSPEVLSSVSKHWKAVMCLKEKYVLDKLHSGVRYSVVDPEYNVSELTIYIK